MLERRFGAGVSVLRVRGVLPRSKGRVVGGQAERTRGTF